ncbi:hypothetical protein JCM39194_13620 [Desulfotomaculum varum]
MQQLNIDWQIRQKLCMLLARFDALNLYPEDKNSFYKVKRKLIARIKTGIAQNIKMGGET